MRLKSPYCPAILLFQFSKFKNNLVLVHYCNYSESEECECHGWQLKSLEVYNGIDRDTLFDNLKSFGLLLRALLAAIARRATFEGLCLAAGLHLTNQDEINKLLEEGKVRRWSSKLESKQKQPEAMAYALLWARANLDNVVLVKALSPELQRQLRDLYDLPPIGEADDESSWIISFFKCVRDNLSQSQANGTNAIPPTCDASNQPEKMLLFNHADILETFSTLSDRFMAQLRKASKGDKYKKAIRKNADERGLFSTGGYQDPDKNEIKKLGENMTVPKADKESQDDCVRDSISKPKAEQACVTRKELQEEMRRKQEEEAYAKYTPIWEKLFQEEEEKVRNEISSELSLWSHSFEKVTPSFQHDSIQEFSITGKQGKYRAYSVPGDGDCLFKSVDTFLNTGYSMSALRTVVVDYMDKRCSLRSKIDLINQHISEDQYWKRNGFLLLNKKKDHAGEKIGFSPETFERYWEFYKEHMKKSKGFYANHSEINILAEMCSLNIIIWTLREEGNDFVAKVYHSIVHNKSRPTLHLRFSGLEVNNHYDPTDIPFGFIPSDIRESL